MSAVMEIDGKLSNPTVKSIGFERPKAPFSAIKVLCKVLSPSIDLLHKWNDQSFRHSEGALATEESRDAKGILRVVKLPSE